MESKFRNQSLTLPFNLLRFTFIVVPIVMGVVKFVNKFTNWKQYNNSLVGGLLSFSGATLMMILGVIEIVAVIIVLKNLEIGGLTVAPWLTLIALTLLLGFKYIKVAICDLIMTIAAFSMLRISKTIV